MPRGRKTSLSIRLTPAERVTLRTWQRSTTIPAGLARRARLLVVWSKYSNALLYHRLHTRSHQWLILNFTTS